MQYPDIAEEIFHAKSPEQVKNISLHHYDKAPENWIDEKV